MADNKAMGFVLVILALIVFIMSASTLQSSVDTGAGTPLENESVAVKNVYSVYDIFIPLIGIFLFIAGIGMLWKG